MVSIKISTFITLITKITQQRSSIHSLYTTRPSVVPRNFSEHILIHVFHDIHCSLPSTSEPRDVHTVSLTAKHLKKTCESDGASLRCQQAAAVHAFARQLTRITVTGIFSAVNTRSGHYSLKTVTLMLQILTDPYRCYPQFQKYLKYCCKLPFILLRM